MPSIGIQGAAAVSTRPAMPSTDGVPARALRLSSAGVTDCGHTRAHNEDRWHADAPSGCFVVADGMGGYNAGEVASSLAVDAIAASLSGCGQPELAPSEACVAVERAIALANGAILAAVARRPECLGMGTTVVCLHIAGETATIGHVGDSRAYLMRSGKLSRLTRDHSVTQALADAGVLDSPGAPAMRCVLTRALGVEPVVQADVVQCRLQPGDRMLLCTDGLTDMLDDATIAQALSGSEDLVDGIDGLDGAARLLLDQALAAGGHDNVTALIVGIDGQ